MAGNLKIVLTNASFVEELASKTSPVFAKVKNQVESEVCRRRGCHISCISSIVIEWSDIIFSKIRADYEYSLQIDTN